MEVHHHTTSHNNTPTHHTQQSTLNTHQLGGGGLARTVYDAEQEGQRRPQPVEAGGVAHGEGLRAARAFVSVNL